MRVGLLTDLKQNLKKGIESTSQRSKKLVDISRLTIAIRGKKEEEERLYRQLGREAYDLWERKGRWEETDSIRASLSQIQSVRETIGRWEKELEKLRKQEARERLNEQTPTEANTTVPVKATPPQPESPPEPTEAESDGISPEVLAELEGLALFICPHCTAEVKEDTVVCPHCQKDMYHD